jgi:multidrug efflux pump subunit AcrA (membrane-fusion protein)
MKKETGVPPPNAFVVTLGNIVSTYSTDGTVKLREAYFLDFPIGGTLMELRKKEGDPVKRGEIIARLDDAYLRIGLDRAAIALAAARANLDAKLASK